MPRPNQLLGLTSKTVRSQQLKSILNQDQNKTPEFIAPSIDREGGLAADAQRRKLKKRRGRASTILAGRNRDDSPINVAVATLLGD